MIMEINMPQPVRFSLLRIFIKRVYSKISRFTGIEYKPAAVLISTLLRVEEYDC